MTHSDPERGPAAVIAAMVSMFATGDLSDVQTVVGAEYLDHQGLKGEPIHGPDGFGTVVQAARSGYETLDVIAEDVIEGHDRVAARLRWHGTLLSGETVERQTIEIVRVKGDRAVEHWGAHS